MKRIVLLSLALGLFLFNFQAAPSVKKHALIIAIGDYPEETNWKDISSVNDIDLIKSALSKQGFDRFVIRINEQADKQGILDAFKEFESGLAPGDIAVIHFSSHGQQIMDVSGDEIDGYDEAIVAYGAPAKYDPAYQGENHLLDEELGDLLDGLRMRLGSEGDVLVTVDACHSGTATRGEGITRGGVPPFAPEGYVPSRTDKREVGVFEESKSSTRGNAASKAPMVVISAARADELNYEFEGFGSLSVAFQRAFENLNANYSYRSLFSKIVKEMSVIAPRQTPALEGDIDRLLFGGEVVNQEPYYVVKSVDGDFITIEGGAFTGLNRGTTIKILPAGSFTSEGVEAVASGTIGYSSAFDCSASLDVKLDGDASEYWVFAKDRTFGDVSVGLSLAKLDDKKLKKSLATALEAYPLANLDQENPTFYVTNQQNGDETELSLLRKQDGSVYSSGLSTADEYGELKKSISTYAQGKFLKNLELHNPDYSIELELIPVKVEGRSVTDTLDPRQIQDEGGMLQFAPGDRALLKITNNGSFAVYFNIIDITPAGEVGPVVPNPNRNEDPKNFKIEAGQSFILPRKVLKFGPPYGVETFKIFASYEPLNFAPILRTRGQGQSRGVDNELEKLFQSSYSMSRGAEVESLAADTDACTFSYTFKIIERK